MIYLKNTATIRLDPEKCNGCRKCTEVCPHAVFEMKEKKAHITDMDRCMECGACALNCEAGALTVGTGVGCAAAVIRGMLGGGEPTCGCSDDSAEAQTKASAPGCC